MPIVHFSPHNGMTACGGRVYGPSFDTAKQRPLFGGYVKCIQHTSDPDFVTCKKCLKFILKEKNSCERKRK